MIGPVCNTPGVFNDVVPALGGNITSSDLSIAGVFYLGGDDINITEGFACECTAIIFNTSNGKFYPTIAANIDVTHGVSF